MLRHPPHHPGSLIPYSVVGTWKASQRGCQAVLDEQAYKCTQTVFKTWRQNQGDILGLPGSGKGRMEGSLDHDG